MCVYDAYTFCVYILLRLLMNVMFTTHHWYYSRLIVYIYNICTRIEICYIYIYTHNDADFSVCINVYSYTHAVYIVIVYHVVADYVVCCCIVLSYNVLNYTILYYTILLVY